ncbi:15-hydroxyprostaglandin dehydrogenase [NAD(+)] [Bombyx mori]|uniref:15-hydroxyprostaglandin dehydrogenase [NAD(+)] n=1 Tax=Bombyx mori TaxID=7091 RepID=A0A8R2AHH5_BOMMO|nr:15-hydroxyprostaglandin dehydrogenase [NAD(+)] [Bombyx mori]
MSEVNDKIVIVTGGANGIGAFSVEVFIENQAKHVAILDIDTISGFKLEKHLNTTYGDGKVKFYKCDVSIDDQLFGAFNKVLDSHGYIDVVVNNAAVSLENSLEGIRRLVDINVTALVMSTLKAIEIMRVDKTGKGGTIINISSIAALKQFCPSVFVYCGTKSAVLQFSNCIGKQEYFSKTGVRVITVCYGPTDTDLVPLMINIDDSINPEIRSNIDAQKLQTAESAARGLLEAYKNGASGSTWLVFDSKVTEITSNIDRAYDIMSENFTK